MNPVVEAIRKKYPDAYKDVSDDDLTLAISKKYPNAYTDVQGYADDLKRLTSASIIPDTRPETGSPAGSIEPVLSSKMGASGPLNPIQAGQVPTMAEQAQASLETPKQQQITKTLETPIVPDVAFTAPAIAAVSPGAAAGVASAVNPTSPAALATLPYMAAGGAEGLALKGLGPASRAIAAAFGAQGAEGLTQSAPEFVKAVREGNIEEAAKAATQTAMNALMVAGGVGAVLPRGAAVETPPKIEPLLKESAAELAKNEIEVPNAKTEINAPGPLPPEQSVSVEQLPKDEAQVGTPLGISANNVSRAETEAQAPHGDIVQNKPAQAAPEQAPQVAAPTETMARAAEPTGEAPPVESPAISETTPEPSIAQTAPDPVDKFLSNIESIPEGPKPPKQESAPVGITPSPAFASVFSKTLEAAKNVINEIKSAPKFTAFKESINRWNSRNQMASLKIRKLQKDIQTKVKDPVRRDAITNWIQADGNSELLQSWAKKARNPKLRAGYEAALSLTPEQIGVADSIRTLYADLLKRAQAYEILDKGLENYVNQVWKRPVLGNNQILPFLSKLSRDFKFARKRTFENFAEGESLGFKPVTKDISQLLGLYISELEKTIATKDLIKDLTTKKAADGNPLAVPEGFAKTIPATEENTVGPLIVRPGVVTGDVKYAQLDHPALAKWKWIGKDEESGRNVLALGELRIHPSIVRHLRHVLSQSAISRWMREPSESASMNVVKLAARAGDTFSRVTKEVMLGTLSAFHHVQEGTHAIGHRVNPFLPEKLPIYAPEFRDALDHGLQVAGDRAALEQFREGLGAHGFFQKFRKAGQFIQNWNDFLFNEYIPRLKWSTYQAILRRNMARFEPEIRSGSVTLNDVKYLSSKETNAAYGHLNYADLGRDATVRHVLRTILLAPDFLEARGRFTAQALKGLVSKAGREQLEAMAILAGTFYVGARMLNQLTTGNWNTEEPFGVRVGNRTYRMRSVPEDIWRAFNETRKFAYGRLNPVFGRGTVELLTGKNYRGENVPASETFKDIITSWIPIQMRTWPGFRNLSETQKNATISAWEQFLGSMGLQVSRYSPVSKIYQKAAEWNKAQGKPEDRGTYPISKYAPLRYALEDGDLDRAKQEIQKLFETQKMTLSKIQSGFKESLNHPFTGSQDSDRKFRRSLSQEDRMLYDEAVRQRERIWRQFEKAQRQ